MVKKTKTGEDLDIFKTLQKIDDSVEIIEDSALSNIKEWIPTGNYILNACISGDLFKGIPSGRVTSLAGESQTGKSYLACSICREAQKMGYTVIYLDSEAGMDKDFAARLGCDTSKFIIRQVNTIRECSEFIANMCKTFQEKVDEGAPCPKIVLVIDSLSQLTSDKERNDTMTGNNVADFTKAKDIKALFRVNTIPLAKLNVVTICINHVYANIGSFMGGTVMAGGCLDPDENIITETGIRKISEICKGDRVLSHDGKFHDVAATYTFEKNLFEVEFEDGRIIKCSEDHRFLVNPDRPDDESSWKTIDELCETDVIYTLED